jgi:hypothetical protein
MTADSLVKLAVAAGCAAFASCAAAKVRTDDMDWLAKCPPESRKTVKELRLESEEHAILMKGENVIYQGPGIRQGVEIRQGPIAANAGLFNAGPDQKMGRVARFVGTALTGPDGASLRFDKVVMEDGRQLPVCGLGGQMGKKWPGVNLVDRNDPGRVPEADLHPSTGYIYVLTRLIEIRLATESWPPPPKPEKR